MTGFIRTTTSAALLIALGASVSPLSAEEQSTPRPAPIERPDKKPPPTVSTLVYTPPRRGVPGGRFGGSSRAIRNTVTLAALVPDHTALTIQAQPVLYWFLSNLPDRPIIFTLRDEGGNPVVDRRLRPPSRPGVQQIRLADLGVHLPPGKQYRWVVTLLTGAQPRMKDVFAGGTIELEQPSPALSSSLLQADALERPSLYAADGLWYDALGAVSELIDAAPHDPTLRAERASLLRQVGLTEAADYELLKSRTSE